MADQASAGQAELDVDTNPHNYTRVDDCYRAYEKLRACPIQHTDALGGFYWLTRYDDVRAATLDGKTYSSALKGVMLPADPDAPRLFALEQEAPQHMASKRLYMEAFTPQCLRVLEPRLVDTTNALIDKFVSSGTCDLMKDFAHPLPVLGVCAAIGVTGQSVERIREVAVNFGKDAETRQRVIMDLGGLVLGELLERRANPRDDYLSRVANAELDGHKMDEGELARFMVGFLTAGHETTTSTLGSFLFHALRDPGLMQRMLADECVLAAAIEETVRLNPPFHAFHRTTTTVVEIGDVTIPAESTVRLCYASANRDPEAFERPDTFDPDRPAKTHFGFGGGRHVCAGAPLARLEIRTAFRVLMSRLSDIRVVEDDVDYAYNDGVFMTPRRLSARFTPV